MPFFLDLFLVFFKNDTKMKRHLLYGLSRGKQRILYTSKKSARSLGLLLSHPRTFWSRGGMRGTGLAVDRSNLKKVDAGRYNGSETELTASECRDFDARHGKIPLSPARPRPRTKAKASSRCQYFPRSITRLSPTPNVSNCSIACKSARFICSFCAGLRYRQL